MGRKLKAVLTGCGAMSNAWLKAAQKNKHLEIAGLVDINEDAARKRKEEFGLANAMTGNHLEAVLKTANPDIVFDCTIPGAHMSVTLAALRHGCHVLGEKPMAENLADARKMVRAAKRAGRLYAVIQNRRYIPAIGALRGALTKRSFGKITTVNSDFYVGAHFGGFRDRMKHVLLVDMAVHTFDMARFISGADPVSVWCKEWNPAGSWYDHDASAVAVFEMSGGIVFTYRGSWCSEGGNTTWEADWRVICENGSVKWDGASDIRAQIVTKRGGFFSEMKDVPDSQCKASPRVGHAAIIHEFIDCVRRGKTPQTICTDNIKSFAMVMSAVESATTGKTVRVKW